MVWVRVSVTHRVLSPLLLTMVFESSPNIPCSVIHGFLTVTLNSLWHFNPYGITVFCTFSQCSAVTLTTAYKKIWIHAFHTGGSALWCMCRVQPFQGCQIYNGQAHNLSETYWMHWKCACQYCRSCGICIVLLRSINPYDVCFQQCKYSFVGFFWGGGVGDGLDSSFKQKRYLFLRAIHILEL